jgi:hypothetical protein
MSFPEPPGATLGEPCLSLGAMDFTGKIVRFCADKLEVAASRKILEDAEPGEEYILAASRAEYWPAKYFISRPAKSRVFIDLSSGSRLAHNHHYFYPLIKTGRYCYLAGKILQDAIETLEYEERGGIMVSRIKVRVISDGLTARLYIVNGATAGSSPLTNRDTLAIGKGTGFALAERMSLGALVGGFMGMAQNRLSDYWFDERTWRIFRHGRP